MPGEAGTRTHAHRSWSRIAGLVVVLFGAYVAWASREYPFGSIAEPGPGFLPFVLASALAVFGAILVVSGGERDASDAPSFADLPHALLVLATLAAAALGIERIGYRAVVAVMLLFFLVLIERRNAAVSLLIALGVAFGSFHLINNVLRVPLPLGPWGW